MNRLRLSAIIASSLVPALLLGQTEPAPETSLSLWGMIKQGGWAMYPLGLCSLALLFLIIHCYRETIRKKFIPDAMLNSVAQSLAGKNIKSAVNRLNQAPSVLSRVMGMALSRVRADAEEENRSKVEASLVEALEGEENAVSQWINYLNVIATVAPMIGLLGTVSGMIGAFQTISQSGMGRPELFAGNIGEALITTATGLVIGIPAMVCFFIMRNRLNNIMLATIQSANTLIDYLEGDLEHREEE